MKSTRFLVKLLLIIVCVASWAHLILGEIEVGNAVNQYTKQAEEYRAQKLYELSLENYRKALEIKQSKRLCDDMVGTMQEYYDSCPTSAVRKIAEGVYSEVTDAEPREMQYWEGYAGLYITDGNYEKAAKVIQKARKNGSSDRLAGQWNEVFYAWKPQFYRFEKVSSVCVQELFAVRENDLWGTVDECGAEVASAVYRSIFSIGEKGAMLCTDENGENLLFDGKGKMIGRFEAEIECAKGYGDGLLPVKLVGCSDWCFLNSVGEKQFGGFRQVGMFQNGKAAVQLNSGEWCLIGTDGQQCSKNCWQEVKLSEQGAYIGDERVIIKENGVWNLYDKKGNKKGDLNAEDMDFSYGGNVAFRKNGYWGFADKNGKIVIEPTYKNAHSFSGGVGAVSDGKAWGFIAEDNTLVIDYCFNDVGYFNAKGYCPVIMTEDGGDWRFIAWKVGR